MTLVRCRTCTGSQSNSGPTGPRLLAASPPLPPLAALAFNHDGTRAAYAVRRVKTLPQCGQYEGACCIFIANTGTPVQSAPSTSSTPGAAVAPFAEWTVLQVLVGSHDAPITALAWCPRTGALLSVSAERSACVWVPRSEADAAQEACRKPKEGADGTASVESRNASASSAVSADVPLCAVPQLVMLSVDVLLCPTCVAWSAEGTKLYIGTSGGTVAVGRYDAQQKWWICRLLDDHHCTSHIGPAVETAAPSSMRACSVTALAAHPVDNTRIAVARLDGTVQVLSTHSKRVDGALGCSGEGTSGGSAGAAAAPFSYVYLSHLLSCWVYGMAWSPSGQQLAVVGHDSGLHVWSWSLARLSPPASQGVQQSGNGDCSADISAKHEAVHTAIWLSQLPLLRCEFASEDVLVAAGFEGRLYAFESAAGSAQVGVEGQQSWQLMPQRAVTRRADSVPSAVGKWIIADEVQQQPASAVEAPPVDVGGSLMTKSVRPQAFDLFERGNVAAAAEATVDSSARRHIAERPTHMSPIHLLVRVPSSEKAAAADSVDATFVSASHDGRVHLWQVYRIDPHLS
ncbi:hypothetical protein GH5_07108 [Leishmania sp. Ghana 2012 LV757]|uniref:hypothetical protein n=1 Tax=Leishmania sp. Ghana 2012 LV757 TaxID=2803181 RepID=UPI001B6F4FA7|nr:hypothetical protein GH5_07108 [Leishmania sp. Ghana 2012 LV757]